MNITLSFDTKKAEMKELDAAYKEYVAAFTKLWSVLHETNITNLDVCAMNAEPDMKKGE